MIVLRKGRISGGMYMLSYKKQSQNLLKSMFHLKGFTHFQKSKAMQRKLSVNVIEIDQVQLALTKMREKILEGNRIAPQQLKQQLPLASQGDLKRYFQLYEKLEGLVDESRMNEEWYFRVVGWYNLQRFFREAVLAMLASQAKREHINLVEAIWWMQPHEYVGPKSQDFFEVKKEEAKCQTYYKKLNLTHQIAFLRRVESILGGVVNQSKGKYFSRYVQANLPSIASYFNAENAKEVDDLVWLYERYVCCFNDKEDVIQQFQSLLGGKKVRLSNDHVLALIGIYWRIGGIPDRLYKMWIRDFLLVKAGEDAESIVFVLKFVIFGQANDQELANLALKNFSKKMKEQEVDDSLQHAVHLLVHYLRVRGVRYQLGRNTEKDLEENCRRYEGNASVARMMAVGLDEKGRREGKTYMISECLRKNRMNAPPKEDKGQKVRPELPFQRYHDIRFCVIGIENCVVDSETGEAVVLEKNFRKFAHSGRVLREMEVRDAVLSHYGFKVNYMRQADNLRRIPREGQSEQYE